MKKLNSEEKRCKEELQAEFDAWFESTAREVDLNDCGVYSHLVNDFQNVLDWFEYCVESVGHVLEDQELPLSAEERREQDRFERLKNSLKVVK